MTLEQNCLRVEKIDCHLQPFKLFGAKICQKNDLPGLPDLWQLKKGRIDQLKMIYSKLIQS